MHGPLTLPRLSSLNAEQRSEETHLQHGVFEHSQTSAAWARGQSTPLWGSVDLVLLTNGGLSLKSTRTNMKTQAGRFFDIDERGCLHHRLPHDRICAASRLLPAAVGRRRNMENATAKWQRRCAGNKSPTMLPAVLAIAAAIAFPSVAAQQCALTLVDDFSTLRPYTDPAYNSSTGRRLSEECLVRGNSIALESSFAERRHTFRAHRISTFSPQHPLNALGGEWGFWPPLAGGDPSGVTIDVAAKTLDFTISDSPTPNTERGAFNPNTAPTSNYFYFQFNDQRVRADYVCYDMSAHNGLQFEIVSAPPTFNFNFTLTQHYPNCSQAIRAPDSEYVYLSKFWNGQNNSVVYVPFSAFATNLVGGSTDLVHLKDITWINLSPAGAQIRLANFQLTSGNCSPAANTTSSTAASTATGAPGLTASSATATATATTLAPTATGTSSTAGSNSHSGSSHQVAQVGGAVAVAAAAALAFLAI
ncbi:hypothetical protein BDK51DRAFT_39045 [Blyttiomyces helicus]|uniref:Uncharacterized protein n=1 Tax=Blyttiomyces helicus TaxID=388810 RepID=A0A4P9WM32_9FUNG|nr:hypothetical protein BDK51DRAFT_39045 [Blyttiomyces helicus]|eukprot:RKO93502.1 hypothetical protein BDK51DRAFT_39045 [Blyttiomyces helicus]